ncbi:MAG: IPT/TIG domain-containing protein, partial [Vicinamibacterales bacterium]
GATVMAVQVFTNVTDAATCGGTAPCLGAYTSDVIAGLERVYQVALEGRYRIASVNMSLGSGVYGSTCDSEPYKPAIDNLRAMDIPSVVAAGNDGWPIGLSSPACISTAVSVGATTKTDSVAWFSNSASFLSLFAPGEAITSAIPGGGYEGLSGTSMAAPHVAGAWAIARQAVPTASVNAVLTAIRTTGVPITDTRLAILGLGETVPRLQLFDALIHLGAAASPPPLATALAPLRSRVGAGPVTLTVSGAQFNWQSVVQWNGVPRTTAFVNSRTLVATIPASDLTAAGTAEVRVSTPAPGGGVSGPLTFNIDPPPSLTVGATTVTGGSQATVTLANGYGGSADWLALAAVGAANTTYLQWTYVGAGVSNRSWTVTMPTTPGQYEFRLLLSNSYTRAATSPVVNVVAATPPAITVSATTVAAGASLTATLTNAPGGSTDWLAFASTAAANGGYLTWIYVGTGTTSRTWTVQAPTTPGTYEFRLFLNGGYILDTRSPAVTVVAPPPPNITVDSSTVAAGSDATATLTNSPGGATDWLALAPTTAGDTSYLQYVYVGAGITNRTWTVAAPATPGTYEFRLFLNNGFTRAATSPPFTVQPGPPVVSTLSPASASAGGAPFTLTVDGSGFTAGSVVRWNGSDRATTYVSATRLRAAILAGDLAAPTTAQITVFAPDGGGLSSPRAFQITPPPALTVDVIAAAGGSQVTVTLTGGLGGATDWLAFASTSAPNTSYVQYVYVGAGVTNRTWTVTTPVAGGIYEFRLFPNNGYTRAATSPGIAVSPGPNPVPTLTSLSPNRTTVGSGTTTVTVNGTGFVSSSIVRFNGLDRPTSWVSPTQMRVVLWPGDLAVGGTAEVTVFTPAPGGGLSAGRPFEIVPPPSLTVSAASVVQGGSVTVTLTDGLGGATDWLALAVAGAPNTSYLTYIYVGPGITTRTWTIPAPGAPGTYEFRLFLNNTYARAATSPTVTVF